MTGHSASSRTASLRPAVPQALILITAMLLGLLLALAVHILGVRIGLNLGGLWSADTSGLMPASAAAAWWLVASVGFVSGYVIASTMGRARSGRFPPRLKQFLIAAVVLVLAAAGHAASGVTGNGALPSASGVIAGLTALGLGAAMAFCGSIFALRTQPRAQPRTRI